MANDAMAEPCKHPYVFTFDSIPPIHNCTECGASLPLSDSEKREYRDYTGRDYVD